MSGRERVFEHAIYPDRGVESKNVVQSGEGRHVFDAAVGARGIVNLQPGFEGFGPLGGG